jgi:hypothetical protein
MDFSTRVPVVKCVWVPATLSYHARHSIPLSPEDPAPVALLGTESHRAQLPGAQVPFELGHVEDLLWTDRW